MMEKGLGIIFLLIIVPIVLGVKGETSTTHTRFQLVYSLHEY